MENYGHIGFASPEGGGIGTFTIYDWGNGAAAEAWNRIRDHYGDVFLDTARGQGFGIDSVAVTPEPGGYTLTDQTGVARDLRVVSEDGSAQTIHLDAGASIWLA